MTKRNRFKIVNNIESCNVVEMLCPRSSQPPIPSSLLTADCTIQYALPLLWNQFILSTHPNNYPYSWQSVGVGFSMVFVCLFFCISQKKATRIIKLDTNMLHNESWKSIYFGFKCRKYVELESIVKLNILKKTKRNQHLQQRYDPRRQCFLCFVTLAFALLTQNKLIFKTRGWPCLCQV